MVTMTQALLNPGRGDISISPDIKSGVGLFSARSPNYGMMGVNFPGFSRTPVSIGFNPYAGYQYNSPDFGVTPGTPGALSPYSANNPGGYHGGSGGGFGGMSGDPGNASGGYGADRGMGPGGMGKEGGGSTW